VTAFHKSERLSPDDETMTEAGDFDDGMSVMASDDGSIHSSSTTSYGRSGLSSSGSMSVLQAPAQNNYNPKTEKYGYFSRHSSSGVNPSSMANATSSVLSSTGKTMFGTAKAALSVQNAAMKMLGHALTGGSSNGDDLDNKVTDNLPWWCRCGLTITIVSF